MTSLLNEEIKLMKGIGNKTILDGIEITEYVKEPFEIAAFPGMNFTVNSGFNFTPTQKFSISINSIKEEFGIDIYTTIFLTEALIDFIQNDFKTIEQIRFEQEMGKADKQINYALGAFILSVITLIITLSFNYFGTVSIKSQTMERQLYQINQSVKQQTLPKTIKKEGL